MPGTLSAYSVSSFLPPSNVSMQVIVACGKKFKKNTAERPSQDPISKIRNGFFRSGDRTRRQIVKFSDAQSVVSCLPRNHGQYRRLENLLSIFRGRRDTTFARPFSTT